MSVSKTIKKQSFKEYINSVDFDVTFINDRAERTIVQAFKVGDDTFFIPRDMRTVPAKLDTKALGALTVLPSAGGKPNHYFLGEDRSLAKAKF